MKTGDYHISMLLHLEDDSIWETPDTCAPKAAMNGGKLQRIFGNFFDRCFERVHKTQPKLWTDIVVPRTRFC